MKTVFALCLLFLGLGVCHPLVPSLVYLQGSWNASFRNADFAVLTEDGVGTVCREEASAECNAEIPNGLVTYLINGTQISQVYTHLTGITTREAAAEMMPSCAAEGFYPTQFGFVNPPSEITSYDLKTGRLVYVDARRPDEDSCLLFEYCYCRGRPYLNIEQRISFSGTLEEVSAVGTSYTCDGPPPQCSVNFDGETGHIDLLFYNKFDLECAGGACSLW